PELVEFGDRLLARPTLGLVHREQHASSTAPQLVGDLAVASGQSLASVHDEDDDVGLDDRLPRLARHQGGDALARDRLEASAVDDDEGGVADPAAGVLP